MDIVDIIAQTLQPKESPTPETSKGEYITKEELENIVTKLTENIESKLTAALEKAATPKGTDETPAPEGAEKTEE